MKKRTLILIIITIIFFYSSLFLKNIVFEFFDFNQTKKEEHLLKIKINCQQIMLDVIGDIEILFFQNKDLDKNEIEDYEKKFNKIIKSYNNLMNLKTKSEISNQIFYFFYQAELIENKLNKNLTYIQINEKYQNYISFFYDELDLVHEIK